MAGLSPQIVIAQLLAVWRETFEGPAAAWSYFTDPGREGGLFGTLEQLPAATASRVTGQTSIAAHVHHLIFSLEVSAAAIQGDRAPRDWQESWAIKQVEENEWQHLRAKLRLAYEATSKIMSMQALAGPEALGEALGVLAHVAYHLGAIKQKVACGELG